MLIKISGSRCVSCRYHTQYYELSYNGEYEAIDKGYCSRRQISTRPGNKCKHYMEKSNIGAFLNVKTVAK